MTMRVDRDIYTASSAPTEAPMTAGRVSQEAPCFQDRITAVQKRWLITAAVIALVVFFRDIVVSVAKFAINSVVEIAKFIAYIIITILKGITYPFRALFSCLTSPPETDRHFPNVHR